MSDISISPKPLLHPVLTLRTQATLREAPGGGKKEEHIVKRRLETQRRIIAKNISDLRASGESINRFGGYSLLLAEMFADSLATTWTPRDLFRLRNQSLTRAAAGNGYIVEINHRDLPLVERRVASSESISARCDISRLKKVRPWDENDVYRGRLPRKLWNDAVEYENGRGFVVWLAPFSDVEARDELLETLDSMHDEGLFFPTAPRLLLGPATSTDIALPDYSERQDSLSIVKRAYRSFGHGRALLEVPSTVALHQIVSSGAIFRIEPARPIYVTSPGEGAEPSILPTSIGTAPIVGLVDGGCTAQRYARAEAWREPPFIRAADADTKHGNQVASVIIHGHEWNNNIPLPELYCRIGVAQAIPKRDAGLPHNSTRLISYIENALIRHPETHVWNLSWNESESANPVLVSALGHELSLLARRYDVLFVVSAGNVRATTGSRVAPPADCEAALVVGGRQFNDNGGLDAACPESLPGFGPEFQLVPHVTTYSPLRILGGLVTRGTSYQAGLISSLAAHTFENLRDPTPDLVRALVLDRTDLLRFDPNLGWGTPSNENLPWNCAPGSVTLAFRAMLKAGTLYYWSGIPIPREMVRSNKLYGNVSLTTIHKPLCNEEGGPNYIATRVGAAIQYPNLKGKFDNLLGSKEIEDTPEATARSEDFKWQPLRRVSREIKNGVTFNGSSFRLYARLYGRNLEQFGFGGNADVPPIETVFVLTFADGSKTSRIYNTMASSLGSFVESAVLNQDIQIET